MFQERVLPSVFVVFLKLVIIVTGQHVVYMTSVFYSAKLPGNKWINGIGFGAAQFCSYFFADFLLKRMTEVRAYDCLLVICVLSQLVMIFLPSGGMHIYIANFLFVSAACGMFSAWLLILE